MMIRSLLIIILLSSSGIITAQGLSLQSDQEGVTIYEGKDTVLYYQLATKSQNGQYPRANYIHPLYNLDGTIITEDFPADHLHHRGIFWAWHQVLINGAPIMDTWDCKNIAWVNKLIDHQQSQQDGTQSFTIKSEWKTLDTTDRSYAKPILSETSVISVHPRINETRVIDISISLLAMVDGLSIGGSDDAKGYGGFSARIKMPGDLAFFSGGKNIQPITNQVQAARWMRFHGSFDQDNSQSGLVIIQDRNNPEPGNLWILRATGSMQNAVFPGRQPFHLSQSQPTNLKYRIVLYKGQLAAQAMEAFSSF